jgi:hypothetical protein
MKENVKEALKTIKAFLGMETKLEDLPLADGMTTIQSESFEEGQAVFIVMPESEPVPLPIGEYELADGRILKVEVEGIIASVEMVEEDAETVEPTEVPVEAEKVQQQTTAKKIVRSTVEEQHFSKLELKIEELEAKILELSKIEEVVEVVELETVTPIKHNPEKKEVINLESMSSLERYRYAKSKMNG